MKISLNGYDYILDMEKAFSCGALTPMRQIRQIGSNYVLVEKDHGLSTGEWVTLKKIDGDKVGLVKTSPTEELLGETVPLIIVSGGQRENPYISISESEWIKLTGSYELRPESLRADWD
jgi:hypothetical protein